MRFKMNTQSPSIKDKHLLDSHELLCSSHGNCVLKSTYSTYRNQTGNLDQNRTFYYIKQIILTAFEEATFPP